MFLELKNIYKAYGKNESKRTVLNGINASVEKGQICVILGSSGCGKSTLLNCIGGLDNFDSGSITVAGQELYKMNKNKLQTYRRDYVGFIFQDYHLIQNLTIEENIEICKYLTPNPLDMEELIKVMGLENERKKFPSTLSGGQQQRAAIARALIKNPKLLLCDEPTGALDSVSARTILQTLEDVNKKYGTTILIVTHNLAIQPMADQIFVMSDGIIKETRSNIIPKPVSKLAGL